MMRQIKWAITHWSMYIIDGDIDTLWFYDQKSIKSINDHEGVEIPKSEIQMLCSTQWYEQNELNCIKIRPWVFEIFKAKEIALFGHSP